MARWNPFGKKNKDTKPTSEEPAKSDPPVSSSPVDPPKDPPSAPASADTPAPEPAKPAKVGMFGKFKAALKKTKDILNTDIFDLAKEGRLVDDEFLDELFAHLIKTDMGVGPAGKIRDDFKSKFRGKKLQNNDLVNSAKTTIREIMQQDLSLIHI